MKRPPATVNPVQVNSATQVVNELRSASGRASRTPPPLQGRENVALNSVICCSPAALPRTSQPLAPGNPAVEVASRCVGSSPISRPRRRAPQLFMTSDDFLAARASYSTPDNIYRRRISMMNNATQTPIGADEEQFMAAARADDAAKFALLTERYRRALHVHCYRMLASYEDAQDMTQETFMRAWDRRQYFQGRGPLSGWLYRIATNWCMAFLG